MVHWIYVIECEDEYIYVGETTRFYRRMNEHQRGGGSINTGTHSPLYLVGLYKVADNDSFSRYRSSIIEEHYNKDVINSWGEDDSNYLEIENHFTELLIYLRSKKSDEDFMFKDGNWNKVRGGKYTRHKELWEKNPINDMNDKFIFDRPCCDCGYPCEVKISMSRTCIYFVCSLKNVWKDFSPRLSFTEPCDFYRVYTDDVYIKKQYEININRFKENWCNNLPLGKGICIKCKDPSKQLIWCLGSKRQICEKCFSNNYLDLKKEYGNKCLLLDD